MQIAITVLFVLMSLTLGITFLVNWIRHFQKTIPFTKLGLGAGFVYLALQVPLIVIVLAQSSDRQHVFMVLITAFVVPISFFKIYIILTLGCHYAKELGYPAFPFFGSLLQTGTRPSEPETSVMVAASTGEAIENEADLANELPAADETDVLAPEPLPAPIVDIPADATRRCLPYAWAVGLVVAGGILYSYLLFWLTEPQAGKQAQLTAGESSILAIILTALLAGFVEEIVFRLGVQSLLARVFHWTGSKYWLAITIAAAFWSVAHVNMLSPYWVKLAQIFPLGLALGWLNWRYGTESSMLTHILFNLIGIAVLWSLISGI